MNCIRGNYHERAKCANNIRNTIENIKQEIKKINPNICIISNSYENAFKVLKCKCLKDGH